MGGRQKAHKETAPSRQETSSVRTGRKTRHTAAPGASTPSRRTAAATRRAPPHAGTCSAHPSTPGPVHALSPPQQRPPPQPRPPTLKAACTASAPPRPAPQAPTPPGPPSNATNPDQHQAEERAADGTPTMNQAGQQRGPPRPSTTAGETAAGRHRPPERTHHSVALGLLHSYCSCPMRAIHPQAVVDG